MACHTGWNFTDNKFHDIGVDTTDVGRAKFDPANPMAKYAFKTPSLRDITQRAPFMHNGSVPHLEAMMAHYISAGVSRPSRSPHIRPLDLNAQDVADVVEFLKTLTGTKQVVSMPVLPN
jgi:cytochrome c peroxidase